MDHADFKRELLKHYVAMASLPWAKAAAWHSVKDLADRFPREFGDLPDLLTKTMKELAMLPLEEPRCIGHGAGASGHQNAQECSDCARRLAPRPLGTQYIEPPREVPCPQRIKERVDA
jgi:hypothetical protein